MEQLALVAGGVAVLAVFVISVSEIIILFHSYDEDQFILVLRTSGHLSR
jgi:hypothetical protein